MSDLLPAIIEPTKPGTLTPLPAGHLIPSLIAAAGDQAAWRNIDFFTANIRNPNSPAFLDPPRAQPLGPSRAGVAEFAAAGSWSPGVSGPHKKGHLQSAIFRSSVWSPPRT
jgi:hypothetical protein